MKKMKRWFFLVLSMAVLLSACSLPGTSAQGAQTVTRDDWDSMTNVWRSAAWFDLAPITVEHGEDAVIQWADPGMEQLMRLYLDRPEGEIYRSDVWDIQVLYLFTLDSPAYVKVMTEPPEGADSFGMNEILGDADCYSFRVQDFPGLTSLEDLQYFESLQVFRISARASDPAAIDLSGLAGCKNLKAVQLVNCKPEHLDALAGVAGLENLWLDSCGTLDLTPLENLPKLSALSLRSDELASLEPLTALPALNYLALGQESVYPSLEPLARTTVRYLDLSLSVSGRQMYREMDYSPLARLSSLVYLNLTNHTHVTASLCAGILEHNPGLKYLDISYTPAANQYASGDETLDSSQLTTFVCIPD